MTLVESGPISPSSPIRPGAAEQSGCRAAARVSLGAKIGHQAAAEKCYYLLRELFEKKALKTLKDIRDVLSTEDINNHIISGRS